MTTRALFDRFAALRQAVVERVRKVNASTEHGTHPHFVCNDCGDVACLPEGAVTLRGEAIRNHVAEVAELRRHLGVGE